MEILWKDLVGVRCVMKVDRGAVRGEDVLELERSLRIWFGGDVRRRVKCLARWADDVGEEADVSRSEELAVGGSLAVVSQMPGWVGGSVSEGRVDVEVIGGIWRDMEVPGLRVMEAMREVEMEV